LIQCHNGQAKLAVDIMHSQSQPHHQGPLAQDDFDEYVNGAWYSQNKIPANLSSWSAWDELKEKNLEQLHDIMQTISSSGNSCTSRTEQLLKTFWESTSAAGAVKRDSLTEMLKIVGDCDSGHGLAGVCGELVKWGLGPVGWYASQDLKDSELTVSYLCQGSLNMGDQEYYLKQDKDMQEIRTKYVRFLVQLDNHFSYLHSSQPRRRSRSQRKKMAKAILELETRLARALPSHEISREADATYHPIHNISELGDSVPDTWDWQEFFDRSKLPSPNEDQPLIVEWPKYLEEVVAIAKDVSSETWGNYLRLCIVTEFGTELVPELFFEFYGRVMSGRQEMHPRWQRMIGLVNSCLGSALGKFYVEKHFPPTSKKAVEEMVQNLYKAFRKRIINLDWMGQETKDAAIIKLEKMRHKIGNPDHWHRYSDLSDLSSNDLINNMQVCMEYKHWGSVESLYTSPDPDHWDTLPQTINAFYQDETNEIVFPAAILQPPFYDPDASNAQNYGAIGAIIGHEITHAFDDQGSKFDGDGNLCEWWTDSDRHLFQERTKQIVAQFNDCAVRGHKVNGELTQGENIADLGGLLVAFDALPAPARSYTEMWNDLWTWSTSSAQHDLQTRQSFFKSWANIWKCLARDEYLRDLVLHDPHSPEHLRINMPLSNIQAFHEAFSVNADHKMYRTPSDRVAIW